MYLGNDPDPRVFSSWLLDVGHGRGRSDDETISLPREMVVPDVDTFVSEIYPEVRSTPPSPEYFLDRIILAP